MSQQGTEMRFPVRDEIDRARAEELRNQLLVLVNVTTDDLVLDCSRLAFIDSSGVGVVLYMRRLLELQGRRLRVENVHGQPRRVLDLLRVREILEPRDAELAREPVERAVGHA
jgi:anti-anti-sigma factor